MFYYEEQKYSNITITYTYNFRLFFLSSKINISVWFENTNRLSEEEIMATVSEVKENGVPVRSTAKGYGIEKS